LNEKFRQIHTFFTTQRHDGDQVHAILRVRPPAGNLGRGSDSQDRMDLIRERTRQALRISFSMDDFGSHSTCDLKVRFPGETGRTLVGSYAYF
jgi:hypothetical protein